MMVTGRPPKAPTERYWAKVDRRGPDECWPWLGALEHRGHGRFWDGSRNVYAHRFALELHLGRPLNADMLALHKPLICHNPGCQNPAHLYEGDASDNMCDRETDGSANHASGERHYCSKLSWGAVNGLRCLKHCVPNYSLREIGRLFGISGTGAKKLIRRENRREA